MAHCYKGHPACWLFAYLFLAASFSCFFHPSMRACRTGGRSFGGSSCYIAPPSPQTQPDTGMFLFFLAALPAALHAPLQAGHKAMPSAPQPQAGRSTSRSQSQTPWGAAPIQPHCLQRTPYTTRYSPQWDPQFLSSPSCWGHPSQPTSMGQTQQEAPRAINPPPSKRNWTFCRAERNSTAACPHHKSAS